MNKASAELVTEEYILDDRHGIYPINYLDVNIIQKTLSILESIEELDLTSEPLYAILESWKETRDDLIEDRLSTLEKEIERDPSQFRRNRPLDFIEIGDYTLPAKSLSTFTKSQEYNVLKKCVEYKLIINMIDDDELFVGNKIVNFEDKEDREIFIEELKEKLSEYTNVRFL